MSGSNESDRAMGLACLLVDETARSDGAAIVRLAEGGAFACPHGSADEAGWIELLHD